MAGVVQVIEQYGDYLYKSRPLFPLPSLSLDLSFISLNMSQLIISFNHIKPKTMKKNYTRGLFPQMLWMILLTVILMLLPALTRVAFASNPPTGTIYVDDDFNSGTPGWNINHFNLIQAAVDAANPGDYIEVAAGSYTEQVTVTKSLSLVGAGRDVTFINSPPIRPGSVIEDGITWDYIVAAYAVSGAIDVRIEGFYIYGNGYEITPGTNKLAGLFMRDVTGATAGVFSCNFGGFPAASPNEYHGIAGYGLADLTIDLNTVFGGYSGITVVDSDSPLITGNYLQNVNVYGITLDNVTNGLIQDNILEMASTTNAGFRLKNGSTGNVLGSDGHPNNGGGGGLPSSGTGYGYHLEGSVGAGNNTIAYNNIGGNVDIQIDAGVTGLTTIDHNLLSGSDLQYAQVVVNGGSVVISNNYFDQGANRGIEVNGAMNIDINHNTFNYGGAVFGIKIQNAFGSKNISYNGFGVSGDSFIAGDGADNFVFDCNSLGGKSGVTIQAGCTGAVITNNSLYYCTTYGIQAMEDLLNVNGNSIIGCAIGIDAYKALTAQYNLFGNNTTSSVSLHSNDNHDLTYNCWGWAGPKAMLDGFNINSFYKDIEGWQGETIQANSFSNFDFVPWLQSNGDMDPDECGFQADLTSAFAPVYANDDGLTDEDEQYPSIQAAIDQSALLYVKAKNGIYTEQVTIDRSVNVMGLVIDGNRTSILIPYQGRTGIVTEGSTDFDYMMAAYPPVEGTIDVKIDGFTFNHQLQNKKTGTDMLSAVIFKDVSGTNSGLFNCTYAEFPQNPALENIGVKSFGNSDLTIDHNTFPGSAGDYACVSITGGDADITYNNFQYFNVRSIEIDGAASFNINHNNFNRVNLESINLVSATGAQRNVSDNLFLNESYVQIPTSGIGIKCWPDADNVTINCNQIHLMNTGILVQEGCIGTVINNNSIWRSFIYGIQAFDNLLDVTGNAITENYNGIEAWKALTAHENLIYYNTNYSIEFHSNDVHDVSNNVYGGYNGPTVLVNGTNINTYYQPQTGDIIQCNSFSNIKFAPWLQNWDDTDPDACGWQPNLAYSFAPVYANDDGSETETEQYGSIQTAIDQSTRPYIRTKAGEFHEQVTINRSVTIKGKNEFFESVIRAPANRTNSISDGVLDWDYIVGSDTPSGAINARVQYFRIDVNQQNKRPETDYLAGVVLKNVNGTGAGLYNCLIHNFPLTPDFECTGVKVFGNSNLFVQGNDIDYFTMDGINATGGAEGNPVVTIDANSVEDNPDNPKCLSGIVLSDGATGMIQGNSVSHLKRFSPNPACGILVKNTAGVQILQNQVHNTVQGINLMNCTNLDIKSNSSGYNHDYSYLMDNVSNSNFLANSAYPVFEEATAALVLRGGSTGNQIGSLENNNNFSVPQTGSGALIGVYLPASLGAGNNSISYNVFSGGKEMIKIDPGVTGTTSIDHNGFGYDGASNVDILLNGGSAEIFYNSFNVNTIRGIEIDGAINVNIHDNTFGDGHPEYAIRLTNATGTKNIWKNSFYGLLGTAMIADDGADNLIFDCNTIWYGKNGIYVMAGCTNASITNNLFYYNSGYGIASYENLSEVTGNSFTGAIGIEALKGLNAHYNYFGANSIAALIITSDDPHDVSNNFWGYYGPKVLSNGTDLNTYWQTYHADLIQCNTFSNIKFAPWLQNPTDTDTEACGFQPDLSSSFAPVYANNSGNSSDETEQYGSIKAAIDESTLVHVFAKGGEYTEKPVIDRPLIMTGIPNGPYPYPMIEGGGGGGRVLTLAEDNITVNGFEIMHSGTGTDDAGVGLVDVTGCVVKNSLIHDNQKGVFLLNAPGNQIIDNSLYNNTVYGAELIGSGQSVIDGNSVYSNPDGVRIGFSLTHDNNNYNVNNNHLSDNTNYGLIADAGVPAVSAECNWWGTNDPSQITLRINGTADFTPWITDGYDPDPAPGFQPYVPCMPCNLLTLTETHVDVYCPTSPSGSVDLTVTGAIHPCNYIWNGPGGYVAYTEDLNAVYPGEYEVNVTAYNGCTATTSVTVGLVDQPAPVPPENGAQTVSCASDMTTVTPPPVYDHCGTYLEPVGPTTGGTYAGCEGTVTHTWSYTDYQSKTATWSFTYTIDYSGGLTPPPSETETVATYAEAVDPGAPDAITDACGRTVTPTLVGSQASGLCGSIIVWTYRYTACDGTTTADWTYTYTVEIELGTLSGIVKYYNNAQTPLNNIMLTLNETAATCVTGIDGSYSFPNLCPGDYTLSFSTDKAVGYINSTDAVSLNAWAVNQGTIEHVKFMAGDVTFSHSGNSTDAKAIQNFFVYGWPFVRGEWTFWKTGDVLINNSSPQAQYDLFPITVNGDQTLDIWGLAVGDFNRSFVPGNDKAFSSTVSLVCGDTRLAGANQEVEIPLRMLNPGEIGAVSLILKYPAELLEVTDVFMGKATGQFDWSAKGIELRAGWNSLNPQWFEAGSVLMTIKGRTTENFSEGDEIRLALAPDPLNELADGNAVVNPGVQLGIDVLAFSTTGTWNPGTLEPWNSLILESRPNPFQGYSMVDFRLPMDGQVTLEITDLLGRRVALLVDEYKTIGEYSVKLDATPLQPGVYMARLKCGEMVKSIKLVRD